jgi:hypothetical protein
MCISSVANGCSLAAMPAAQLVLARLSVINHMNTARHPATRVAFEHTLHMLTACELLVPLRAVAAGT